ncbi:MULTISPECIES: amidohydrolase [Streptomyces]|uniref:Amidohydrolase YtcJ n=1 Tax=Streptomyces achromogenes TaxID=67255 RepID=A0ABU0PTT0_STRAH|nr:amidohydrolase [Streptomyces achromogenes]MDQ0681799.1 putative amidohydrolase YtcJ [Streptomyces achromogenes]MDQ0828953.1 putative amidohydrolase YtcJ [Streptomyces achromogenes]
MNDSAPSLVLTGGQVLTVDGDFTVTEGVAVRGRDIVAVGSDAEMRALAGPGTRLVELGGRTVLPGINDSHLHGAAYGMTKPPFALDVGHPAVGSIADIADAVGRAARAARPGDWIVGLGWDAGYLAECLADPRRFPHRRDLDAVAPDNPVCLTHFSSHLVWVNSAALRRCGVDADSVPPPGGVIDADPDGRPAGILREAAQEIVNVALPTPSVDQRRRAIQGVVRELHSRGITSYTEPGLGPGGAGTFFGGLSTDNWTAYADLAASGGLEARVSVLLLPAPMGGSADDVRKGLAELRRPESADPRLLNAIGVKIFADGVPPNRTAWMSEPYSGGGHGALCVHGDTPALRSGELREMISVAHEAGFQLGVHVTGDRAIDEVVDAFVAANAAAPRPDARHYVIHGDFVGARSLAKLAAHGYGVNMNPAIKWTISDLMDEVVGPERSAYQWPVRSAVEAGVRVCASSDAPITEPDWRQGVSAMLLRESKASGRASGPEQCVPLAEALRAYTVHPARQDFAEEWKGSIEVGKVADLCVLDRPLLDRDPHTVTDAEVDLTVFDGRVVHER